MNNDMKLGIFSWFGFVMPFRERLKLIKQAGFDVTCIWWEDEEGLSRNEMPKIVLDSGLSIDNIHTPFCDSNALWSETAYTRKKIIQKYSIWLEDCAKHDIPIMVMHLTEGERTPKPNKYGIESMETLVKIAEALGVKIAIENTCRRDNIPFVLSSVPSGYLGFCFDTSHANLTKGLDSILLTKYKERLLTTHISDNDGAADRHWIPGNGEIDWEGFGKLFPVKTYKGTLMLEVCPRFKKSPGEFLRRAFESIFHIKNIFLKTNKK